MVCKLCYRVFIKILCDSLSLSDYLSDVDKIESSRIFKQKYKTVILITLGKDGAEKLYSAECVTRKLALLQSVGSF